MIIRLVAFVLLTVTIFTGCQKNPADFANGDFISYRHDLNVGASAVDLLRATKYKSITIELQYLETAFMPEPSVLTHLTTMLETRLNKPGGITIVEKEIKPSQYTFGLDQIRSIEETSRTIFTEEDNLSVYILYLNGNYAADSSVLGAAYRNTSIVIFGKTVEDFAAGDMNKKLVFEATVLEHEFCHLLGLVDEGTPLKSPHKDAANGNHCTNKDCLMYFAFMDSDHASQYNNGLASVPVLDSACIDDLQGNGGK